MSYSRNRLVRCRDELVVYSLFFLQQLIRRSTYSSRSEVTNRVVFGLITWFAGPGKSSREFVYIYIFFFKVYVRGHVTCPPRYRVHQVLSS